MSLVGQPVRAPLSPARGGRAYPLVAQAAPLLVRAKRPLLPLARAGQDALRGRCGGNPAAEDDRGRGRAGLPRVPRALPILDCPRASAPGGISRTRSGHSGSGGRRRWHSSSSRSRSRSMAASSPARARSWSACRGSAPTRRARCWPSCTGEPSRSSMSTWPASWGGSSDHPRAPRRSPQRTLHALALRLVSGKRSLEVNWAALDFGALVCRARRPLCPECPLRARCQYARSRQLQPTPTSNALSGSRSAGGR